MGIQTPSEDKPLKYFQWGLKTLAPNPSPEDRRQLGIETSIKALCLLPPAFLGQQYSKRRRAEGRGQKAEGERLTGKGFRIWLCPNRLGGCYNLFNLVGQASRLPIVQG